MTISRSNYVVISITMVILLLLFQFTNISTIFVSHADTNSYLDQVSSLTVGDCLTVDSLQADSSLCEVAVIGSRKDPNTTAAQEWCCYTKQNFYCFSSLTDYIQADIHCGLIIVYSDYLNDENDISSLCHFAAQGTNLIFATLPDVKQIRNNPELAKLLGIKSVIASHYQLDGMTLFEDFLLSEKYFFEDWEITIPYVSLLPGTKAYMVGILDRQEQLDVSNENLPPVIWRNKYKNSFVFVSNNSLLTGHTGIGILTAMQTEMNSWTLYPVVNAQTMTLQNYPYLSEENQKDFQKRYSYSVKSFYENVLWPSVVSILHATDNAMTCIMAPQLSYNETQNAFPQKDTLNYFMNQIEKRSGDVGISGTQMGSSLQAAQKTDTDFQFYDTYLPDYTFTIFAPDNMKESEYAPLIADPQTNTHLSTIRTLYLPYKEKSNTPLLSYYNSHVLRVYSTMDGFSHSDMDELRLRSLETALGISHTSVDFSRILYPESEKDDWTHLSTEWSRFQGTYWKNYSDIFDALTVSEADTRIRRFMAMDYSQERKEDTITITIDPFYEEAYFILRTDGESIAEITGGSYKTMEAGRYLLNASNSQVTIRLQKETRQSIQ